ncbi:MAG TPA: molybdopterin molybdotransferase MoeA [Rubricoccaceae bacterium]
MISVSDADQLLAGHVHRLASEAVGLAQAAGRVLREPVVADRDMPPADRVTMDGVALRSADVAGGRRHFPVASAQHAGEAPHTVPEGACVEVMTGSVLPAGADAVVPVERLRLAEGMAELLGEPDVVAGRFVHRRGSNASAGQILVRAGTRLGPTHIAALASVGTTHVGVGTKPCIAMVTTGDEAVPAGTPVLPHLIRQSNGPALAAALALHGYEVPDPTHAPDAADPLRTALAAALAVADVVLVTGGVSMGRRDLVPETLAALGVQRVFHRVAQRPGKPLWFGVTASTAVFGLPGNPVSCLTCLVRYVIPFLAAMEGAEVRPAQLVRVEPCPDVPTGLTLFAPVRLAGGHAEAVRTGGSGDLVSLLPTDGVAELALGTTAASAPFFPWRPT